MLLLSRIQVQLLAHTRLAQKWSVTSVPENLRPSSGLCKHCACLEHIHIWRQIIHTHKMKANKSENRITKKTFQKYTSYLDILVTTWNSNMKFRMCHYMKKWTKLSQENGRLGWKKSEHWAGCHVIIWVFCQVAYVSSVLCDLLCFLCS